MKSPAGKQPVTLEFLYEEMKANSENTTFLLQQIIKVQGHAEKIDDKLSRVEKNMVTKADLAQLMGELLASREEQVVSSHQQNRTTHTVEVHEKRLALVEKKIGIGSSLS